jgi:hypothetical protein
VLESLAYAIGLVPDDGVDVRSRNYFGRGGDHVRQKRLTSDFVEDFGVLGFESRAFAGGHDGDGDAGRVGCGHRVQYSASDSRQSLLVASRQSLVSSRIKTPAHDVGQEFAADCTPDENGRQELRAGDS